VDMHKTLPQPHIKEKRAQETRISIQTQATTSLQPPSQGEYSESAIMQCVARVTQFFVLDEDAHQERDSTLTFEGPSTIVNAWHGAHPLMTG